MDATKMKKGLSMLLALGLGMPSIPQPARAVPPTLIPGDWTHINPPGVTAGDQSVTLGQGLAMHPTDPMTLFWCNGAFSQATFAPGPHNGLWKTTDGGGTWTEVGDFGNPLVVRIDPNNPQRMYLGDGVRGPTNGFWITTNGGATWTKPAGYNAAAAGRYVDDVYDIAVNPTDFNHILVSSHSPWDWNPPLDPAGIMESKDGGVTWTVHEPQPSWGWGHSIAFLYDPDTGQGNANTWLLGTQGDGMWRTTNAGQAWTKVTNNNIFHGGNHVYYSQSGVLYSGGETSIQRSTDNGATWVNRGVGGTTAVFGDGTTLYTAPAYASGSNPFFVSPETDGNTWTAYSAESFTDGGPYEMAYDAVNGILYSSSWFQGVMALKLTGGAPPPTPPAAPSNLAGTHPSAGRVDLTWDDNSSDEQGFAVERSSDGGSSYVRIATPAAGVEAHSDTGLPTGSYTYRVRSYKNNLGLVSNPSNTVTVSVTGTVPATPPAAPTNLAVSLTTGNAVVLTWDDNATDEAGFLVERSSNGGSTYTQVATPAANAETYQDNASLAPGTYHYRVRAHKNAMALLSTAVTTSVVIPSPPGPGPGPGPQPSSVVPQDPPMVLSSGLRDGQNDTASFTDVREVEVLDARGRVVYNGSSTQSVWDGLVEGQPAPPGFYLARIKDIEGKLRYRKILVVK